MKISCVCEKCGMIFFHPVQTSVRTGALEWDFVWVGTALSGKDNYAVSPPSCPGCGEKYDIILGTNHFSGVKV